MKGKNYILSIAIDQYRDKSFNLLNNAKFDAERLQNILIDKYGFDTIQDILVDKFATREGIIGALENLNGFLTANDNVIIYFAGHGKINPKTKIGFWIPYDATNSSTHNYINNSTVIDCVKGFEAKHVLIISDSCFSGTFLSQSRGVDSNNYYSKLDTNHSRWLLSSGRDEIVSDGEPGLGSPFANSLIEFLDGNTNKVFSFSELAIKVTKDTSSLAKQQPIFAPLSFFPHEGGEMIFKLKLQIGKSKGGWEANFQLFCDAKETRPEWPYISKENPETRSLGIWCVDQRRFKREGKLKPDKEQRLHEAGFIFNPNVQKFFNGLGKFLAFMHNTGYNYVPNHLRTKYTEELAWLRVQQKSYKKNPCDPKDPNSYPRYRYEILKKNGIEIEPNPIEDTWPQFKLDLEKFYKTNDRYLTIPSQVSKDKEIARLGNKLNDYMASWKKGRLVEDKVKFLSKFVDINYKLNKDKREFEKQLARLNEFQKGDRNKIPKQGKKDVSGLGQWYAQIKTALQPKTTKKLPQWKIDRLKQEGIIK